MPAAGSIKSIMSGVSRIPPFFIAVCTVASAATWGVHLAIDPDPFRGDAAAVLSVSLIGHAVIGTVGLLIARSRWARRHMIVLALVMIGLGIAISFDPGMLAAVILAGGSLAGLLGPWLGSWLRRLPSITGPSPIGVTAVLSALAVPGATAMARSTGLGPADWVIVGWALISAWELSRARPAGLWALRLGLPATGVAAMVAGDMPMGILILAATAVPAVLAWRHEIGLATMPLVRPVPIPPELAPPDLLDSAGYDNRGVPREET
jgi:hypothetical protein